MEMGMGMGTDGEEGGGQEDGTKEGTEGRRQKATGFDSFEEEGGGGGYGRQQWRGGRRGMGRTWEGVYKEYRERQEMWGELHANEPRSSWNGPHRPSSRGSTPPWAWEGTTFCREPLIARLIVTLHERDARRVVLTELN
jgi:hypothetical protein